jgi:PAS domain S-box-containing protein
MLIISTEEEKKILERVVTGAIELTNTISGALYLISDDGKSIINSYRYPTDLKHPPPRMHKKDGYTRQVIETGKMFIIPDFSNNDRVNPELLRNMRAMVAVPLKIGEKVVGVLFLHDKEPRSFTEKECSLLEILTSQAAITIAIARELSFRQTLLNNSPYAIVAIDKKKKGAVKEFNKASKQIFGYTWNEVINKSIADLWGGIEEAKRINHLLHDNKNGTVRDIEAFVTKESGEKIPALFSGSLLYSEEYGEEKEEIGSIGHLEDQRIVSLRGRTRRLFEAIEEINRTEELPKLFKIILYHAINLLEADYFFSFAA